MLGLALAPLLWAAGGLQPAQAAPGTAPAPALSVGAFGAVPDDGRDDLAAFRATFAAAAARGVPAVQVPAGTYQLSAPLDVVAAVRTLTLAPGAVLRGTGSRQVLTRKGRLAGPAVALTSAAPAGASTVSLASTAGLTPGSWLFLGSDDTYMAGKQMRPGFLRRVLAVNGDRVTLDKPLHRALTMSPRAWRYALAPSLRLSGGVVEEARPAAVLEPAIELIGVDSPVIDGTEVRSCGGAGVRLAESVGAVLDVVVHDCLDDESGTRYGSGRHYGYGVDVMGASRDVTVRGRAWNVRHGFTTDPGFRTAGAATRGMGEPEDVLVSMAVHDTTSTGLDTHESGYRISFVNCTVTDPGRYRATGSDSGKEGGGGFFVRARQTVIANSTVTGAVDQALQVAIASAPSAPWSAADATRVTDVSLSGSTSSSAVMLRQPAALRRVHLDSGRRVGVQVLASAAGSTLDDVSVVLRGPDAFTGLLGGQYATVRGLVVTGDGRQAAPR